VLEWRPYDDMGMGEHPNEHDPNMQIDYTGTNYSIMVVELDAEVPHAD
jgi:hypothetical protein